MLWFMVVVGCVSVVQCIHNRHQYLRWWIMILSVGGFDISLLFVFFAPAVEKRHWLYSKVVYSARREYFRRHIQKLICLHPASLGAEVEGKKMVDYFLNKDGWERYNHTDCSR